MNKVKIITDSCSSLSIEEMKELGVDYVEMTFTIEDDLYSAFECPIKDPKKFYETLKTAKKCSTGCVNTQTFLDKFQEYTQQGYDVFYTGLSGGLSSTYNNALFAADEINKTSDCKVYCADSQTGSYGIAIVVKEAIKLANEGKSAKEIYERLHQNKLDILSIFIPSDLQFLMRSGRLNKIVASIGSLLKIVPIMGTDSEGKLKMISKCIGRRKAIKTVQNLIEENINKTSNDIVYIAHTGQEQEVEELKKFIEENTQNKEILTGYIDYTMGCCCGPDTIAIFIIKK